MRQADLCKLTYRSPHRDRAGRAAERGKNALLSAHVAADGCGWQRNVEEERGDPDLDDLLASDVGIRSPWFSFRISPFDASDHG